MDAKQAVLDAIAMCVNTPGPNATEQLVNAARVLVAEYQALQPRMPPSAPAATAVVPPPSARSWSKPAAPEATKE